MRARRTVAAVTVMLVGVSLATGPPAGAGPSARASVDQARIDRLSGRPDTPGDVVAPSITLAGVAGSATGVAWSIRHPNADPTSDLPDVSTVHYQTYDGTGGTVEGAWSQFFWSAFRLVGSQLTVMFERRPDSGLDITDGAAVGSYPDTCERTAHGCFNGFIERGGGAFNYQVSYTPDSTGVAKSFAPPPIEGTVEPGDASYARAVDDQGAIINAWGQRADDGCCGTDGTLDYLDFATGTYTVLDDSKSAEDNVVAMDADTLVWTSSRHLFYLDRDALTHAPMAAAPTAGVVQLAINGHHILYTAKVQPDSDDDYTEPTVTYSGTIGGTDFTPLDFTPTGPTTAINDGDFGVSAGTTSADFGLYRFTPGSQRLGERVVSYGIAPYLLPTLAPNDYAGNSRSAQTVVGTGYHWSVAGGPTTMQLGAAGDIATPTTDVGRVSQIGVFRPSTGTWYQRRAGQPLQKTQWGQRGDRPVAAHYAGLDAPSVLAVYRPASHRWYVRGRSSVPYGATGDVPVPGHYYGTAADDYADQIAIFRPSTGTWWVRGHPTVRWGQPGDVAAPADYDGDGRTDYAIYRPSTQRWYVRGRPAVRWGLPGDVPVTGDFDGDARSDLAIYRPSTRTWWVRGVGTLVLGATGDTVVGRAPFTG